jgi:putative heme-binding domain-containing protein
MRQIVNLREPVLFGVLLSCLSFLLLAGSLSTALAGDQPSESTILKRLEAFSRITPQIYSKSPRIQQLVSETITALNEDPRSLKLIRKFKQNGHSSILLKIATNQAGTQVSDDAISYLLANEITEASSLIDLKDHVILKLLARNGSAPALTFLLPTLQDPKESLEKREALVRTLCTKKTSATLLLKALEKESPIENSALATAAVQALRQTPWTEVQSGFEALVPSTSTPTSIEEFDLVTLISTKGNIEAGREAFRSLEHTCVNCHVAEGVGNDIGPGLSEIGVKLGKDALFDAIINPSSGISFDYEGWNITLNSGDEVTGIVLSKTETQWTIKNLLGQTIEVPVGDIFETQKMTTSLMPSGLGHLLGENKLVDLVTYLSTLGK